MHNLDLIREGEYGNVYFSKTDPNVVIKIIHRKYISLYYREIFHMILLQKTPHIAEFTGYGPSSLRIHTKRYQYDLRKLAYELPYNIRCQLTDSIIEQMLKAISKIHSLGIIHADIKIDNIFCDYDPITNTIQCYLGDFGLSTIQAVRHGYDGMYQAPEDVYSKQIDIWALGATIIQFLTKTHVREILQYDNMKDFWDYKIRFPTDYISDKTYHHLCNFMKFDPNARFSFPEFNKLADIQSKINDNRAYNSMMTHITHLPMKYHNMYRHLITYMIATSLFESKYIPLCNPKNFKELFKKYPISAWINELSN